VTSVAATGFVPVEGLALLFAVDNFLSMARALANVIGNGVATIVVAKLENEFIPKRLWRRCFASHNQTGARI
jgi:Na+/H+-dicarboxylate symporter